MDFTLLKDLSMNYCDIMASHCARQLLDKSDEYPDDTASNIVSWVVTKELISRQTTKKGIFNAFDRENLCYDYILEIMN